MYEISVYYRGIKYSDLHARWHFLMRRKLRFVYIVYYVGN